jgi:hypothetical protein
MNPLSDEGRETIPHGPGLVYRDLDNPVVLLPIATEA